MTSRCAWIAALLVVASGAAMAAEKSLDDYMRQAMRGDYGAQRNVAYCLQAVSPAITCPGVIAPRLMLACAWRIVILGSGHRSVDRSDVSNHRHDCGPIRLTDQERAVALRQAEELFRQIYKRELPPDTLVP